ncbi:MAG: ATPase domain-containing protein [Nanoarchaeota archaeon]|nr:ATPase domain-containing protein [Nanoarchaeota archaeon]
MIKPLVRIPSGIPGFDDITQGGFRQGSINLVAGDPGTGKTLFAIQFLMQGLLSGEAAVYITFEEKRDKLFEDMMTLGWDLELFEKKGLFSFMEYSPEQVKKLLVEGGGTIEALIQKTKAKRLVIDSISSFTMLYQDELTQKEAALSLFELIGSWNCTAVLTSQNTQIDQETVSAALEFEVDSIIVLYHLKVAGIRKRAIEILKMRGTQNPEKTLLLNISPKGLVIDPNQVVTF